MLKYTVFGQGTPLVFLHGALVDENLWFPKVTFIERDYRVILISLLEHGDSSKIRLEHYDFGNVKKSVVEVLAHLRCNQYHMCGHYLGGMMALDIALTRPDLIKNYYF